MRKLLSVFVGSVLIVSCSNSNDEVIHTAEAKVIHEVKVQAPVVVDSISYLDFLLDTNQHYRGLFIDSKSETFFVAGSKGHVAFGSMDFAVPFPTKEYNADSLHLRDIQYADKSLFTMSIGYPGKIYEQIHDPKSADIEAWTTRLHITDTNVFMDGMDFWNNGMGLVYGDPLDDYHFVFKTENKGQTWERIKKEKLPAPIQDEAGFAASGTGVVCLGEGVAYIAWGGERARVFKTTDYGETWTVFETPIAHGKAGKGIYCMAWKNELEGVIAGGNWEDPEADSCYAYTKDGGNSWHLGEGGSGYRSGLCHSHDDVYFSVGTKGMDISLDGGATWTILNDMNLNAIQADPNLRKAIAVGSFGKGTVISY